MKKLTFFLVAILMFCSCRKENVLLPTVILLDATQITEYSAIIEEEIVSDGGSPVLSYGIFYDSLSNPENSGTELMRVVSDSVPDIGRIALSLDNLIPNTIYYVKAYARNIIGISYGEQISFITKDGPISKNVQSIAVDHENNIWCGTIAGLAKFDGSRWINYTTTEGLINNDVQVVVVDKHDGLWIGTKGGLSHFDGSAWENYTENDGLVRNEVSSIALYPENDNILIGTVGNGISGFNGYFTAYFIYPTISLGTLGHIHTITYDLDEHVWIGSSLTGLSMSDGKNWFHHINGLDSNVMASICTSDGILWFGTASGAYRYSNNLWTFYSESDGLISNDITSIAEGKDGEIWFGTTVGLSCLRDNVFINYEVEDGLISNSIRDLAIDLDGNIWMATDMGISKINYNAMR